MRPTERTIQRLKNEGALCGVTEKWVVIPGHPGGGVRRDLFDVIDCIALLPGEIRGIQCGAMSGHSGHVHKCMASEALKTWLTAGGTFYIYSWGKRATKKKDGTKGAERWACKMQQIYIAAGALVTGDITIK